MSVPFFTLTHQFLDHFNIPSMYSAYYVLFISERILYWTMFFCCRWCYTKSVTGHVNRISIFSMHRGRKRENSASILTYCFLNAGAASTIRKSCAWTKRIFFFHSELDTIFFNIVFWCPCAEFMVQYWRENVFHSGLKRNRLRSSWYNVTK